MDKVLLREPSRPLSLADVVSTCSFGFLELFANPFDSAVEALAVKGRCAQSQVNECRGSKKLRGSC